MNKNKNLGCISLLLLSPLTMAMQPMDDQSLSTTTGQDGLSIGAQIPKIQFNQLAVIDTDGLAKFGEPQKPRGALVIAGVAGQTTVTPVEVSGLSTPTSTTNLQMMARIDSDAGNIANGGAFANIAVSFGSLRGIRISPLSIYMASDTNNALSTVNPLTNTYTPNSIFTSGTLAKGGVKELLRIPMKKNDGITDNNIDIIFTENQTPTMNIQLGAAPQGNMIRFGGAIDSICGTGDGCNFLLVSDYTISGNSATAPIGLGGDFQLKASNATGFGLNNFYANINDSSLVFGNVGVTDPIDLTIKNVKMGNNIPVGSFDANIFNGLQNGSIGNIGMREATIDNFKMTVKGL